MTLPRVSAAAVAAGQALDRADTLDELDAIWEAEGCAGFRGAAGIYLRGIDKQVRGRIAAREQALQWARAI